MVGVVVGEGAIVSVAVDIIADGDIGREKNEDSNIEGEGDGKSEGEGDEKSEGEGEGVISSLRHT